jgi:formylglycine-generating enzyme required for sulfatase activity/serine/threonine protein kinase
MPASSDDDRVLDLLERWEGLRRAGQAADIETLCAGCPELADRLRRRIADLVRLDSLLMEGDSDSAPTGNSKPDGEQNPGHPASPDLLPAVMPFRDLRFHARGGLGDVFEGYDESLQRSVAIKLLSRLRSGSPENRRRFENEAAITSGLEHPGIAPVYGVGADKDGRPYYAMRFIRGETFQEAIERFHAAERSGREPGERQLAFRQLLVRFQEVCNTIAYAHNRGVLHRDLKPRNVMLGDFGETIVVDWGLGKRIGTDSPLPAAEPCRNGHAEAPIDPGNHTLPHEAMGSPGYMSPEQASGDYDRIGTASDVYSLGAILYCLLTGRPPITGSELASILRRTEAGDFPRPSQVSRRVPPALEAVCLKAMALKPDERYASPKELAEEIGRWMADEPVSAWREPWTTRGRRWVRRHRMPVSSAAVALASCLIGLGYVLYDSQIRAAREAAQRLAQARGWVEALKVADIRAVPEIVRRLDPDVALVADDLDAMARPAAAEPEFRRWRTVAVIARLHVDPSGVDHLVDRLTQEDAAPAELDVIREVLQTRAEAASVAPRVWKLLEGGPRARSEFVHFLARVETQPDKLFYRILSSRDDDLTRATRVLALGGYPIDRFPPHSRERVVAALVNLYRSAPDSGLHSALDWLLRRAWGLGREHARIEEEFAIRDRDAMRSGRAPARDWYVNSQMQTLAVIRGPVQFGMGSPIDEVGRRPWAEDQLTVRIERTFAIATQEVTRAQYGRFLDMNPDIFRPVGPKSVEKIGKYMPEPECPVVGVTWYEAARYCDWLSRQEGIPESEWCYPGDIDPRKPLRLDSHYLSKTGYRLPTEAEWEFACRAGTQTARPFGESEAGMSSYAWFLENSDQRTHRVGSKMPNDLGLFDMLGNAIEWTFQIYDSPGDRLVTDGRGVVLDREIRGPIEARLDCMLRGGSFYYNVSSLRSANRNWNSPALRENTFGFRVARTLRLPDGTPAPSNRVPRGRDLTAGTPD